MRTLGSAPILGPLHDAAKNGDLEQLKQLLDQGTDIEEQDRIVGTALHWAALTDNAEVAQALIAAGADVNSVARGDGTTALHVAAPRGSTEVAAALIEAGANINARNREGRTPLHIAAASNASGAIELLVRSGVDIDEKLRGGATPLSFAVFAGQVDAVRTLLKLGADVNGAPDVDPVFPSTPLKLAIASGLKEIADILRAAGATE